MAVVSGFGPSCSDWRCGVEAEVSEVTETTAMVTVKAVWQSIAHGFDVSYCEAWTSCDGQAVGATGITVHADAGETIARVVATQNYWVYLGEDSRLVECAASFVMPDVQPGSSRAAVWVEIPAEPCDVPAAPAALTASRVNDTTMQLSWTDGGTSDAPWRKVEMQARDGSGEWGACAGGEWTATGVTSYTWQYGKANTAYTFRARAVNAAGASAWTESVQVATTPAAPGALSALYADGTGVVLTWRNDSPYADGFKVQRSADGSTWTDAATLGAVTTWTDASFPAGTGWYRVAAVAGEVQGAWATSGAVSTASSSEYPAITLTVPSSVEALPFAVSWTVSSPTSVRSQAVSLIVGGVVVESAAVASSKRSHSFGGAGLPDGGTATVVVTVTNAKSLTTTATASTSAAYVAPAAPTATVAYDDEAMTATVTPASTGGTAAAVAFSVVRIDPDGTAWTVADEVAAGDLALDRTPPLNAAYSYRVTARARSGKESTAEVAALFPATGGALNFDGGEVFALRLDWTDSETAEAAGTSLEFADGGDPVFYPSGSVTKGVSASWTLTGSEVARFKRVASADAAGVVWLRSPRGRAWHGHPAWTIEDSASGRWTKVSCSIDVTGVD